MTSSVTSTSGEVRLKPDATGAGVRLQADKSAFRPAHFFVLASLMAATAAVIMSRQSTPEHLVLISVTIGAAGLAAAGFYRVLSPLVGETTVAASEALSERSRAVLTREKTLVLRALKDLEFDRSMGKVSAADFEEMSRRLRSRAMSLMKQLDEDASGYRIIIERELSARLSARAAQPAEPAGADIAPVLPAASAVCTCGTSNDPDAVFCKRCGSRLQS